MFLVLCCVSEFQGIDLGSAGTDAKVFDGDVFIAAATVETCWVQQFVEIKENDQLPGQSGEAGNAVTAFGQHGVRRGLNALGGFAALAIPRPPCNPSCVERRSRRSFESRYPFPWVPAPADAED